MQQITIDNDLVKKEFTKSTEQFHVITTWIGLLLNIVWCISDYFVLPDKFLAFFIFRASVSLITVLAILSKKLTGFSIYTIMFILVIGISVQNSYMWSVMDLANLQKHAFAYMVLFIGVGMLVLWDIWYSIIIVAVTIITNIIFYVINSKLTVDEFTINGGLLVLTVAIFCIFLIRTRYRLTMNEIRIRLQLEESNKLIEQKHSEVLEQKELLTEQKEILFNKNKEITDSINYAKRLQEALLPPKNLLDELFGENYFLLYKPRDIVCGDFYWVRKIVTTPVNGKSKTYVLLAVADCTGHGVPGAFMSLLGSNFLHQSATEKSINSPAEALDYLNSKIISTLNHGYGEPIRDGMDIALVAIDMENMEMAYAGANSPIYLIRDNVAEFLKATKQAIGNLTFEVNLYTNTTKKLQKGDCIYLFTDGYADQFGGEIGKKLMRKSLENTFCKINQLPLNEQKTIIEDKFLKWKGELDQVDDVCVIGIKI